jgi:hypothetical protein
MNEQLSTHTVVQVCTNGVETVGTTMQDGLEVLDKMLRRNVTPDQFTFSLLFSLATRAVHAGAASFQVIVHVLVTVLKVCISSHIIIIIHACAQAYKA